MNSENVSTELDLLPLLDFDEAIHFKKKPKYKSEILNLLKCQQGSCPGNPLSSHITPLLGKSKDGTLVFPRYTTHPRALQQTSLASIKLWLLDLIDGLTCLHSLGIIHRDIRIHNVVFSKDSQRLIICDIEGRWGNREAPEILHNKSLDCGWSQKSDIYDIGPFIKGLVYANTPINSAVEWPVPSPLNHLVEACMQPAPDSRPSLEALRSMVSNIHVAGSPHWPLECLSSDPGVSRRCIGKKPANGRESKCTIESKKAFSAG